MRTNHQLPPTHSDIHDQERRRVIKELWIIGAVALFIGILFILEAVIFHGQGNLPFWNNILFFALINTNLLLICVLLFLIFRNLAKLVFERRAQILGSKLKTKLVAAFVSFALIPTIIMFYVSMSFITRSLERWFSLRIETSLEQSIVLAQTYYKTQEEKAVFFVQSMTRHLTPLMSGITKSGVTDALLDKASKIIVEKRAEYLLDGVELYIRPDSLPAIESWQEGKAPAEKKPITAFLLQVISGGPNTQIFRFHNGEIVLAASPLFSAKERTKEFAPVVVVGYWIPKKIIQNADQIKKVVEEYRQLQVLETPLKTSYMVILAMISLFLVFGATWFGFRLAKGISVPISKLAEYTLRVASGDLDFVIDIDSTDEIGTLVSAFNKMKEDLRSSRYALEAAAKNLTEKNVEIDSQRRYLDFILRNVTVGVISIDQTGRISTINPAARVILGLIDKDPIGWHYREISHVFPSDIIEKFREELAVELRGHASRQLEISVNGQNRMIQVVISVLRDDQDRAQGVVCLLEDLTDTIKAQRMSAWQEVARRIAHEIKNPLTPIQLAAQRLKKRYASRLAADDTVFIDSTTTIIKQVETIKNLVKEFSDFSRIAEARPVLADLNGIISEVVILYSEAHKSIRFIAEKNESLPQIMLDPEQIKRVFINLLDNAVAAITAKGEIKIDTALIEKGKIVRIVVADNGVGIPEEYKYRIFEPYFSTKKMGTGLGLAIVNRIIRDHYGTIKLEENSPKGTRVVIDLPIRDVKPVNEGDEVARDDSDS